MSYACAVKENGMPATLPAIAAQSAVWFAKCACTRSTRTATSQRAAARAFGVTARSRACDQGFFPAARCSAPRVRRTAMGRASSIRRAPARIPASMSAGLNTPAGRRRANVPCRSAVAPRYNGTTNTSWPASWTSIISFTTNGCEGAGGKAGITYAMRMPGSHPLRPPRKPRRRASRRHAGNAGSDRERRAAAAGVRGLRVRELEAAAVEARHEVDLGAGEVLGAARIDQDPDPVVLEHLVVLPRLLVEAELVAEPRAPAPHHRDPERVRLREPPLCPHLLHHLDRPGREDEPRACLLAHATNDRDAVPQSQRAAPRGSRRAAELADSPHRAALRDFAWRVCLPEARKCAAHWHMGCSVRGLQLQPEHAIGHPLPHPRLPRPPRRAARDLLAHREDHRLLPDAARERHAGGRDRRSEAALVPRRPRLRGAERLRRLQHPPLPAGAGGDAPPGASRLVLVRPRRRLDQPDQPLHRGRHEPVLPPPRVRHLERERALGLPRHHAGDDRPRAALPVRLLRREPRARERGGLPARALDPPDLSPHPRLPDRLPG